MKRLIIFTNITINKINKKKKERKHKLPMTGIERISQMILWTLKIIEKYYKLFDGNRFDNFTKYIPWKTQ